MSTNINNEYKYITNTMRSRRRITILNPNKKTNTYTNLSIIQNYK